MSGAYDRDRPSTYADPKKCGGCNWYFDLAREGMDEPDEGCSTNDADDRITLCGTCKDEAAADAENMVRFYTGRTA